ALKGPCVSSVGVHDIGDQRPCVPSPVALSSVSTICADQRQSKSVLKEEIDLLKVEPNEGEVDLERSI
ncbi:hypothetical protein ZEAMMB73_Zm00001d019253, partial [Zea mays]